MLVNEKRFPLIKDWDCSTYNVVYILQCKCGYYYVGETSQNIKLRWEKHKPSKSACASNYTVPCHFQSTRCKFENCELFIFAKDIKEHAQRLAIESYLGFELLNMGKKILNRKLGEGNFFGITLKEKIKNKNFAEIASFTSNIKFLPVALCIN